MAQQPRAVTASLPLGEDGVPVPGIDPTNEELALVVDLPTALAWAGIGDELLASLEQALGGPLALLRNIVLIDRNGWDWALQNTFRDTGEHVGLLATGRLESLRRIARLRCGLCPGDHPEAVRQREAVAWSTSQTSAGLGAVSPWTQGGGGGSAPIGAPPPASARRIKLSQVLDPTLDAEVVPLGASELKGMHARYKQKRGAQPSPEVEPTDDQLSALAQVLAAGHSPYADFSIFGRHGRRLLQKLQYVAFVLLPDSTWQRKELPGPPNITMWWAAWRVLKTSLLLLEEVSTEVLDQYGDFVRDLGEAYGDECWGIIYLADVRMRSEEFPRLLRREQIRHDEKTS